MLEVVWTIVLTILLEAVGVFILEKIGDRWKPFEKKYNDSLSKNKKVFSMVKEPNSTTILWVMVVLFSILWIIETILIIILSSTKQINTITAIIVIVSFSAICFPYIIICLHQVTKKIFVAYDELFIKSIFIKKKYNLNEITNIKETTKKVNILVTRHTLEITFKKSKIKILDYYSNYDLLKNNLQTHFSF